MSTGGAYFQITLDPLCMFGPGPFSRLDFVESLAGSVWADGTEAKNLDNGLLYRVEYHDNQPTLVEIVTGRRLRPSSKRVLVEMKVLP